MLTAYGDNARSGADRTETVLTPAAVSGSGGFGLRTTLQVDGEIATQPLFVSGLATPNGVRDVVFVTTRKSQITAFDAQPGTPVWGGPATVPDPHPGSGLVLSPLPGALGQGLSATTAESASAWHGWFPVPGAERGDFAKLSAGQPITALWNPGPLGTARHHLDLFAVNESGQVISTDFDNDKWLGGWFAPKNSPSGTSPIGRPEPVPAFWSSPARLQIFVGNSGRSAATTYWEAEGACRPWAVPS